MKKEKNKCPECLVYVYQEELDLFDGICEACTYELDLDWEEIENARLDEPLDMGPIK